MNDEGIKEGEKEKRTGWNPGDGGLVMNGKLQRLVLWYWAMKRFPNESFSLHREVRDVATSWMRGLGGRPEREQVELQWVRKPARQRHRENILRPLEVCDFPGSG